MKNKISVFISCTVLSLSFFVLVPVSAMQVTQFGYYITKISNKYYGYFVFCNIQDIRSNTFLYGDYVEVYNNADYNTVLTYMESSFDAYYSQYYGTDRSLGWFSYNAPANVAYIYNLPQLNTGVTPVEPAPPPDPEWYELLWSDFKDFVSDLGLELLQPFDPNSIIDIADWFENAWTVKVGEGEDDLLNQIEVITPTPTPVPPTPIPYQTIIVPDGNGGSIIQYKYINPSGTPIITDQPPQQNVTVNNDDNGFEYPYYENPDNKDNPFKFKIPWYLKLVLRNNDIDIDTLDDHYQVAQNQVQSDEVVEAVNEVYNGFQVLPTEWLLLLGAIASIPLFAALIHRFLQG